MSVPTLNMCCMRRQKINSPADMKYIKDPDNLYCDKPKSHANFDHGLFCDR